MYILENIPLSGYSTMRLGGNAAYLCEISDRFQIAEAVAWADERKLPVIMIGTGSNIIWRDEGFQGLVIVNKIMRFEQFKEDSENLYLTVGAGENWDSVVDRATQTGFSGLEELSLIPGTAGATPVQNVGAYGREVKDVLATVETFDRQAGQLITLPGSECEFGYRTSRFKTTDKGRFFISAVTFHLTLRTPKPPFYDSLQRYFNDNNITVFSPKVIREAVIAIRSAKLPDPNVVANNGSFFQNPIIPLQRIAQLQVDYPDIVYWPLENGSVKVSAAWLMEQAGFKDYHDPQTGMGTWPKQPLVFVNENATSTASLEAFKQNILDTIKSKFDITLNQEPEILP